jgi:hypothetical protein
MRKHALVEQPNDGHDRADHHDDRHHDVDEDQDHTCESRERHDFAIFCTIT